MKRKNGGAICKCRMTTFAMPWFTCFSIDLFLGRLSIHGQKMAMQQLQALHLLCFKSLGEEQVSLSQKTVQVSNHLILCHWPWLGHMPVPQPITVPLLGGSALNTIPAVSKLLANLQTLRMIKVWNLKWLLPKVKWMNFEWLRNSICSLEQDRVREVEKSEKGGGGKEGKRGKKNIYIYMISTYIYV